ncbi:hypothetical protein MMC13_007347 [Lambiella insularis]|nr:hypothetical protein [Lambiella insularis]
MDLSCSSKRKYQELYEDGLTATDGLPQGRDGSAASLLDDWPSLDQINASKRQKTVHNPSSNRINVWTTLSGNISPHNEPKGKVRDTVTGDLEWFSEREGIWRPAVYHQTLRMRLIEHAASRGRYDHGRAAGEHPEDVTSYLLEQKSWGAKREELPDIVLQIGPGSHLNPTYDIPLWYDNERIVLNTDNHPVRRFRDIPDTISSEIEGGIITAIRRLDPRILVQDFIARMPHQRMLKKGDGYVAKNQFTLHGLRMRAKKFADRYACLNWTDHWNSDRQHEYLMSILPQSCKELNSVRGFRDLTKVEIKAMRHGIFDTSSSVKKAVKERTGGASKSKSKQQNEVRMEPIFDEPLIPTASKDRNRARISVPPRRVEEPESDFDFEEFMNSLPDPADMDINPELRVYTQPHLGDCTSPPNATDQYFNQAFTESRIASDRSSHSMVNTDDKWKCTAQFRKLSVVPIDDMSSARSGGLSTMPNGCEPRDSRALCDNRDQSPTGDIQQPYYTAVFRPSVALDVATVFGFIDLSDLDHLPEIPWEQWTWD